MAAETLAALLGIAGETVLIIEWPCGWAGTGDVGRPVFRSARFTDSMQECRHQPETGSKAFEERVATGVFSELYTRQRTFAGLAAQDGQCLEMRSILGRSSEGIAESHRSFGWTLRSELRAARIRLLQRCQCDCAWRGAGSITPDVVQDSVNDARSETTAAVTLNGVGRDRRGRGSWTTWLVLQCMGSLRCSCAQSCFATKGPGSPTSVSCAVTPRSSHTREAVLQPATIMFSPLRLRAVMLFVCQTAIATAAMWMFCSSLRLWHCLAGFQTSLLSPLRLRAVQPTCNQRQWPHATSACVMHSSQSSCGCIGFTLSVLVPFAISTWPNISPSLSLLDTSSCRHRRGSLYAAKYFTTGFAAAAARGHAVYCHYFVGIHISCFANDTLASLFFVGVSFDLLDLLSWSWTASGT